MKQWTVREVPISSCVHYCGFLYGGVQYNPYETYICGLHEAQSVEALRRRFLEFIQFYRPKSLGEAIGAQLTQHYPLWYWPWSRRRVQGCGYAWVDDASEIPDILTHFCEDGVPLYRITEEFAWLERAYYAIGRSGYAPERYGFVCGLPIVYGKHERIILTDGNHRTSALHAFGKRTLRVRVVTNDTVNVAQLHEWPAVQNGDFSVDDAMTIVEAYLSGNQRYVTTDNAARINA